MVHVEAQQEQNAVGLPAHGALTPYLKAGGCGAALLMTKAASQVEQQFPEDDQTQ